MLRLKLQYLATLCKELTRWKRPWCWEGLKVGEKRMTGWNGWMALLNQWTWVWVSSGSWWWTGKPGVLQSTQWIFNGKSDTEAEVPILWPPDVKKWFIGKGPDAGRDWRQEEKGMRGWDGWMASSTHRTWVRANSGSLVMDREAGCAAVHGVTKSRKQLSWTKLTRYHPCQL